MDKPPTLFCVILVAIITVLSIRLSMWWMFGYLLTLLWAET